jgi:gas vesicle protein
MFKLLYASLKYFALGLVIGLLTAPRPGNESRRLLQDQIAAVVQDTFSSMFSRRRTSGRSTSSGTTPGASSGTWTGPSSGTTNR